MTEKYLPQNLPVIAIHIQETGLREHIEPIIYWLAKNGTCNVYVLVTETQYQAYQTQSIPLFSSCATIALWKENNFIHSGILPQVVLSLHPETPSKVAKHFNHPHIVRIVMQHGLSDKSGFYDPNSGIADALECYDGVFLSGPAYMHGSMDVYAKMNPHTFERLEFFAIGSPKTDKILQPSISKTEMLQSLSLDPQLPVVTFAPTYERHSALTTHGEEIINALCTLPYNVIIKLHHISLKSPEVEPWILEHTLGKNWADFISQKKEKNFKVQLAGTQNTDAILAHSDVLISDASGIAYEYLVTDKPVIFYDVPELFKQHGTDSLPYWGRAAGIIVTSTEDLSAAVQRSINQPEELAAERKKIADQVLYNIGQATEAAGKTLLYLANSMKKD